VITITGARDRSHIAITDARCKLWQYGFLCAKLLLTFASNL